MSDTRFGTIALLLAGLLPAGAAVAQTQSSSPTANAATGLAFPATLGGATFERSVNYAAPPTNQPDEGFSYFYSSAKKLPIVVQIYDGGRRVAPGSTNPTVVDEFMGAMMGAESQARYSGYRDFERPSVPSSCTYGSMTYRCITYSAVNQANARVYSKVLMTGYHGYFVSIRIDWSQARQQTAADAEAGLQTFVPALIH